YVLGSLRYEMTAEGLAGLRLFFEGVAMDGAREVVYVPTVYYVHTHSSVNVSTLRHFPLQTRDTNGATRVVSGDVALLPYAVRPRVVRRRHRVRPQTTAAVVGRRDDDGVQCRCLQWRCVHRAHADDVRRRRGARGASHGRGVDQRTARAGADRGAQDADQRHRERRPRRSRYARAAGP